jgi:hypothetical protein
MGTETCTCCDDVFNVFIAVLCLTLAVDALQVVCDPSQGQQLEQLGLLAAHSSASGTALAVGVSQDNWVYGYIPKGPDGLEQEAPWAWLLASRQLH